MCARTRVCGNSVTVQSDILTPVLSRTHSGGGKGMDVCDGLHSRSIPPLDAQSRQRSVHTHTQTHNLNHEMLRKSSNRAFIHMQLARGVVFNVLNKMPF